MALSGITDAYGIYWGNVYQGDDLQEIMKDSDFLRQISMTCGQLKASNPECRECAWRSHCSTGCRAEALTQGNGINGPDRRMCLFFKNGYYERLLTILQQVNDADSDII